MDINLDDLGNGLIGLTEKWGAFLAEAGGYCFYKNKHKPGIPLQVIGPIKDTINIHWDYKDTTQYINSYQDDEEAVEHGACSVAISIIFRLTKYTVIERSSKGGGFDYWLGDKESDYPFQRKARLEVSGIMNGNKNLIRKRVNEKIAQTEKSKHLNLPAIIAVTEFSRPELNLVEK